MAKIYLGLGTNLGDKEKNLRDAIQKIGERIGNVSSLSAFYATAPWGFQSENTFLNAVACVETALSPHEALAITQQIERENGRTAKSANHAYADRLIDIDLLMAGDQIINEPGLILPHPLMHKRRFVMEPFAEIAPDVWHPVLGKTIHDLYINLSPV
jgi:2-amino-4-hydroxy-6-hydroxymethyldihydropteridine diphosphokinase